MKALATYFLLASVVVIGIVSARDSAESGEPVQRLTQDLMTMDIEVIQRRLGNTTMLDSREIGQFLLDIWNERRDKYPELPWGIIKSPQVRVWLAMTLAPVGRYGRDGVNTDLLREYVWSVVDSPDDAVVRKALYLIGGIDEIEDVNRIKTFLAEQTPTTNGGFYGAVWALAQMCNEDASTLLNKLAKQERDQERQSIIVDLRRQWDKQKLQSGYCKMRSGRH